MLTALSLLFLFRKSSVSVDSLASSTLPYKSLTVCSLIAGFCLDVEASSSVSLTKARLATEALWKRLIPLYVLLFTSLISLCLILIRDWRSTSTFENDLQTPRVASAIHAIVQIISSVLGLLQTYSVSSIINFATRLHLMERSTTLKNLNIWNALSTTKADFGLPIGAFVLTAVFIMVAQIPGALWAGAITPVLVTVTRDAGVIQIPTFTNGTRNIWDSQFQLQGPEVWNIETDCTTSVGERGYIASCPVPALQGAILNSAGSATTLTGGPRNHSKIDNPEWVYHGRSYGLGSSQGIIYPGGASLPYGLLKYNYTEVGYEADVTCLINSTSNYTFGLVLSNIDEGMDAWSINGYLPNSIPGNPESYPAVTLKADGGSPLLAWSAVVNDNKNMIAITAGQTYANLDKVQCSVDFTSTDFNIAVNVTEQSITVSPVIGDGSLVSDFEPTGRLSSDAMWSINLLSRMSTSLYVSVLGNTLSQNANTSIAGNPDMAPSEATLRAVEDSFASALDDVLVALGSAQLVFSNSTAPATVTGDFQAARIGGNLYIFATAGLNFGLILLGLIEAVRTRLWRKLPVFNYTDVKSVVVASSAGLGGVSQEFRKRLDDANKGSVVMSADTAPSGIRVKLVHGVQGVQRAMAIVLVKKERSQPSKGREREETLDLLERGAAPACVT